MAREDRRDHDLQAGLHRLYARTEDTIDCRRFTGQHPQATSRTFSIATPTGLQNAVTMVRAILVDATAPSEPTDPGI